MKRLYLIYAILFFLISLNVNGQNNYEKDYITITPDSLYKAGWFHEFLLGEHWRDAWLIPIKVEILDLEKFAGGLTPLKRGGGFQTKSLRFTGNDGHIWKFRSIKKNPAKVLPEILRKSLVADIFQDQISSAYPLAALVAAPIISAVGILQAKPYLVYMPNDPKLGEFREDFGNLLGMIEIHPDVDEEVGIEFENADKIKSTFKLFERLAEKRKEKVDVRAYLKARLVDLFLGDWDRHTDQWKWARYEKGNNSYWEPIPRDRDQVFAKWDGVGPRIAEYMVSQFNNFGFNFNKIKDMSWSGRFIDRRFLTEINKTVWDSVTTDVISNLTDEVIENALKHLPKEHYDRFSEEIIGKLKSRRNQLADYSTEYYNLINSVVDIYATNKDDIVEVERLSNKETLVSIYDLKKKSGKKKLFYKKVFNNCLTKELRIRTLDGNDSVIISGEVDSSPLVRVLGGKGKDKLVDNSKVNGYLFSILPIPCAENKTEFYDSGKKTIIKKGSGTKYYNEKISIPKTFEEKYEPQQKDRSQDWFPSPVLKFNSSDGIKFGMGAQIFKYNFRMVPYEYWMNATINFATRPGSFSFNFNGVYNSIIRNATVTLDIDRSRLLFTNYYGLGNETTYDEELDIDEFYRIDEDLFSIKSAVNINYYGNVSGAFGIEYRSSKLSLHNNGLSKKLKSNYGLERFNLLEIFSNFSLDTRNNSYYPESGFYINLETSIFPKMMENKETFFRANGFASYFVTLKTFTEFTFALKTGGGVVIGKYPFFESIFLGGSDNLRGFTRRRFAGDSGIFGQFELRTYLFPLKAIVPGKLGWYGFIESGRVYDDVFEDSDKWHPSYGGGLWVSFVDNSISASFSMAKSSETTAYYFNLGMGF